jgi:hypothetical protein
MKKGIRILIIGSALLWANSSQAQTMVSSTLSTIEGKLVKSTKNRHQLSLAGLVEGIYFLRISDMQGRLLKVEKVVKQ